MKLILGNWKMNGSLAANAALLQGILSAFDAVKHKAQLGVCAPFVYLDSAAQLLKNSGVALGAQDCSAQPSGAFTGEIAAPMLAEFGVKYVLLGHSERRQYHGETSSGVAAKAQAALAAGLTPVVCVGETLAQREGGATLTVISEQLAPLLALGAQAVQQCVIAYEPVWAIGTGLTASPAQAQEIHAAIAAQLAQAGAAGVKILYGGSMKPDNAKELLAQPNIDGGLIGGAALKAADFLAIAAAA